MKLHLNRIKTESPGQFGPKARRFVGKSVHIWSGEHRAYWRPHSAGYTTEVERAGTYDFMDAYYRTRHCGPEKKIVYELMIGERREMMPRFFAFQRGLNGPVPVIFYEEPPVNKAQREMLLMSPKRIPEELEAAPIEEIIAWAKAS